MLGERPLNVELHKNFVAVEHEEMDGGKKKMSFSETFVAADSFHQ